MPEFDSIKVKDQLGRPEDKGIFVKRKEETCIVEEGPTVISSVDVSSLVIWGRDEWSSDSSYEWEGSPKGSGTVYAIVNPNNIYRERFTTTYFKEGSTTADWADTEGELSMTNAEIAVSEAVAKNTGIIYKATLNLTISSGDVSDLACQMASYSPASLSWENVTLGTEHTFTTTGTILRFKITASGSVTITALTIEYKTA